MIYYKNNKANNNYKDACKSLQQKNSKLTNQYLKKELLELNFMY